MSNETISSINTDFSNTDLTSALNQNVQNSLKPIAIRTLAEKGHLTLERVVKLLDNPTHGPVIASITIDELVNYRIESMDREALADMLGDDKEVPNADGSVTKQAARSKAKKTTKAETGTRTKLDRDAGYPAIKKALKSLGESGMSAIVEATEIAENHLRTMLKELVDNGDVVATGAGRGRKYNLA